MSPTATMMMATRRCFFSSSASRRTMMSSMINRNCSSRIRRPFSSTASITTLDSNDDKTHGNINCLALTVKFQHPDFGMTEPEVLSRATTFLLSVDRLHDEEPSSDSSDSSDESSVQHFTFSKEDPLLQPAKAPQSKNPTDLRWLEFVPPKHRPKVHCVVSSHVVSPWKFPKYYPQEWITHVKPEHCTYSIEVLSFDNNSKKSLAEFELHPFPIHHPNNLDLAIVHLQEEEESLKTMLELGVQILDTRDFSKDPPVPSEPLQFDGFEITKDMMINSSSKEHVPGDETTTNDNKNQNDIDTRVFIPYRTNGTLLFGNNERFIASTSQPLPQGLCGGPVLDNSGKIMGVIEGIVPLEHENPKLAGQAAFIPTHVLREFLDTHAEPLMLKEILPNDLFQMAIRLKEGKGLTPEGSDPASMSAGAGGASNGPQTIDQQTQQQQHQSAPDISLDEANQQLLKTIAHYNDPQTTKQVIKQLSLEREQVLDILEEEGGDLDDIIMRVRAMNADKIQVTQHPSPDEGRHDGSENKNNKERK